MVGTAGAYPMGRCICMFPSKLICHSFIPTAAPHSAAGRGCAACRAGSAAVDGLCMVAAWRVPVTRGFCFCIIASGVLGSLDSIWQTFAVLGVFSAQLSGALPFLYAAGLDFGLLEQGTVVAPPTLFQSCVQPVALVEVSLRSHPTLCISALSSLYLLPAECSNVCAIFHFLCNPNRLYFDMY